MELASQVGLFVITLATGVGLAALFDFYRVIRGKCKLRAILTFIGDFIYWALATCIVFGMLLAGNGGEIRFYVFMGLLSGVILYYQLFSRFVIYSMVRLFRICSSCVKYVLLLWRCLVCRPGRWLLEVVLAPFAMGAKLWGAVKKIGK